MPSAAQKQMDINRRLNDLLNQKDTEIVKLTQKIMDLQEEKDKIQNEVSDSRSIGSKINPSPKGKQKL